MSSNGGGGSNLLDMGLMIAAGVAAPELAPVLFEGGLAGSTALATGVTGAALSGGAAAVTGQNVGRAALFGGAGGALAGALAPAAGEAADVTSQIGKDVASMQQAGANAEQINQALQDTYGMTSAQAAQTMQQVATTGSTAAGIGMQGANLVDQTAGIASNIGPSQIPPATPPVSGNNFLGVGPATNTQMGIAGLTNAYGYAQNKPFVGAYNPPKYTGGNLSKFRYDPNNYTPDIVTPPNPVYQAHYAEGGITQLQGADKNFAGGGMYPGSQIDHTQYASSPQTPMSMQATMASYDPATNPLTGEPTTHMAKGGIAGLLKGRGDGMSDSIHATIADKQPARLADGEFVIPADVVSHLGNGSTDAGAKHLYKMMDKVRHARTGNKKQGKQISAGGYLPA